MIVMLMDVLFFVSMDCVCYGMFVSEKGCGLSV